jgi:glycosyltransferase involved in cell wall biosynthesis
MSNEMARPKVTILAFGFNERQSMAVTLPAVKREWADRLLYVDGGSKDGSAEYAASLGWDVLVQKEPGLRNAYREAFALCRTERVLIFSPDGNTPAEDIPRLLAKLDEGFDLVIGSRYLGEARSEDDTAASAFANWFFTRSINLLFARGTRLTDAMTNYRAFRTALYYELGLDEPGCYAPYEACVGLGRGRLGVEPLLSARALRAGARIGEIPSNEPPRHFGAAKFPKVRGGLGYVLQLLSEWLRRPVRRLMSERTPEALRDTGTRVA